MKIQLDWPIDSIDKTRKITREFDFLSVVVDIVDEQIILEATESVLRTFVFGTYTALLQSKSGWVETYGIPSTEDFVYLVVKN